MQGVMVPEDLQAEMMPTSALVPYAGNAKRHPDWQVEQIANSIQAFGFNDPIAVWHDVAGHPVVVEGHGRLLAVLVFSLVIRTPAPEWFDGAEAFAVTLGGTPRVLCGSFLAFLLGDLANDRLFRRMKEAHPDTHEGFGARAILSSVAGEVVDSLVFFPIAFGGQMPVGSLVTMALLEVALKVGYEVVVLPVTRAVVEGVTRYEAATA